VFNLITIREVAAISEATYLHWEVQLQEIITVGVPGYPHLSFLETKAVLLEMGA
jgi:hypothetical protein